MSKTKTVPKFFTIADYEEETIWLSKQHKNGWKLKKITFPFFYTLEECTPEEIIYQLDYKNEEVNDSYLQIYKDYGWEYCESILGWNYFRKSAKEIENDTEKEIFSDRESKVQMIENILKTRMLPLLIIFFLVIIPNLRMSTKTGLGEVIFGIYVFLFILYMYIFIHCGFKLMRMKKNL